MVTSANPQTIHAKVRAEILKKIVDGEWPPGFQLPIETELAKGYGVSRMTMNKVLTRLSAEGYVYRRKKKGTFVAEPRAQSAVMEITDIEQEVSAHNRHYHWKLLQREKRLLSADESKLLDIPARAQGKVLFLRGVHFSDDKPFCLETRLINPVTVDKVMEQDFKAHVPGSWLLKALPWTKATHKIRAINVGKPDARLLDVEDGHACLEILRNTEIDSNWVTWARLIYPGEAHQLVAQF